jgi:hypothetical protein
MKVIIQPEKWEETEDLTRAFENFQFPTFNDKLTTIVIDAPKVKKFVNLFLNSNLSSRVEITPTELESVNYAGLFSGCKNFSSQPILDNSKNVSMAAMFKNCENLRVSLHNFNTSNVVDFRQCFWGATNFSGNGIQSWNFSNARSPNAFQNFFGGNKVHYMYYDKFIESLYNQMKAGTLPTPMNPVDMANSQHSAYVSGMKQELIEYGWNIVDGGPVWKPVEPSKLERIFFDSIYNRLTNNPTNWLEGVDLSPLTKSSQGGILITPKHMIFTNHWKPGKGKVVTFWNGQTAIVESVNVEPINNGFGDIVIATLNRNVTECNPVLFLPKDWRKACPLMGSGGPPTPFPKGKNTPLVWWDQRDKDYIAVVNMINNDDVGNTVKNMAWTARGEPEVFYDKYKYAIPGDSGSPMCFLFDTKLVLCHLVTVGGTGAGSFANYIPFRNWLDNFLNTQGYQINEVIDGK